MPLLHTAFQEGFVDDEVVLRVAGREVLHAPHLKTRTQIGLATTNEAVVAAGPIVVEITLPRRNLSHTIPLRVTQDTYLGVSLTPAGQLQHVISQEPFGYL